MKALTLSGVSKRYGKLLAVDELTFNVPQGAICGLVGPNGAGKTTTLGILGGLLGYDAGTIRIGEHVLRPRGDTSLHGVVSLMPQDALPSDAQSVRAVLEHLAALQSVPAHEVRGEVTKRLDEVGLGGRGQARFSELSHGMRRRFGLAQALLGKPQVLLLDEPTSGLDPEQVVQVRDIIKAQRGRATVLVSSHVLSELEAVCDFVVFMSDGRCTREGYLADVTAGENRVRYRLLTTPDIDQLHQALPEVGFSYADFELAATGPAHLSVAQLNALVLPQLLERSIGVVSVTSGASLEDSYLKSRQNRPGG